MSKGLCYQARCPDSGSHDERRELTATDVLCPPHICAHVCSCVYKHKHMSKHKHTPPTINKCKKILYKLKCIDLVC